ncbi:uncharacterized protein [Temnothorax nylanderi]|uniref:uncharacterized protein n=1 Tax=Temnothorax nylanderi TaxID=102681 RepID=UPI003A846233
MDRMYRRNWNPDTQRTTLVATDNIIITFKADKIRDLSIFRNGVALRVRPYVPQTRQCFNCFRYGHTKIACKSETRCIVCGDKFHGHCDRPVRCCNCEDQHKSTYRGCPVYKKNINIVMAYKNVSFHSARRIVEGEDPSKRPRDRFREPRAWPELPQRSDPSDKGVETRNGGREPPLRDDATGSVGRTTRSRPRSAPAPSNSAGNYYGRFDTRAGEISREKKGIALSAMRNGSSWAQIVRGDFARNREGVDTSRGLVDEVLSSMLQLLQRFPEAREILIGTLLQTEQGGQWNLTPAPNYGSNEENTIVRRELYRRKEPGYSSVKQGRSSTFPLA